MASTKNGQEMMHERLKFTLSCVEKDYFSFTRYYSYETRLCMISHFQTTRISIISHLPFTEQDFGSKIKNPITFSQYFYVLLFPNPAARDKLSENNLHSMQEILACGKYLRHKKDS